jgi:hypothetical protein
MPAGVPAPINFGIEAGQAVAKAIGEGKSPLQADIPSEVGGPVDVIWDTTYEQPGGAEDSIDVPGPNVGETTDWLGITDGADPNQGDPGFAEFVDGLRNAGPDWLDEATGVLLVVVVIGATLWLLRPLLTIGAEVVAE